MGAAKWQWHVHVRARKRVCTCVVVCVRVRGVFSVCVCLECGSVVSVAATCVLCVFALCTVISVCARACKALCLWVRVVCRLFGDFLVFSREGRVYLQYITACSAGSARWCLLIILE